MSCLVSRHRLSYYVTTGSRISGDNCKFGLDFVIKNTNINVMKTRIARVDFLQPCSYMQADRYDKLRDQRYAAVV